MPNIPVKIEFDHKNSGPQNVPANTTQDFTWPAPAGWIGISWGFTGVHPILEFQTAGFGLDENGQQRFFASIRNPSGTDRSIRFTFVLMKLD